MEFSLDSYDWLMIQNVYSMGMWVDGGLTMRKPYISTAGYVIKMSNYKDTKANHEWVEIWRCLFYYKIANNKDIFRKTPYIFQLKGYDKMTSLEHNHIKEVSEGFIEKVTK
jgi:deoxyribodipyrimidine photolyase-related protein